MKEVADERITPHLNRAIRDLSHDEFETPEDEKEAVACLAIYYVAPIFWSHMQARVNEYDETMQSYGDLQKFQNGWKARSDSVLRIDESSGSGGLSWAAI